MKQGQHITRSRRRSQQIYVCLPEWAAEELRARVESGRVEDPDLKLSQVVRRIVLATLRNEGIAPIPD